MTNQEFTHVLSRSFHEFLETGSRSNEKLKILHGAIARDLKERLGNDFKVLSLGIEDGHEGIIRGRYIDKKVDIVILNARYKVVGGIGVKFVMQNYAQNSNNYFENMLGETANIQCNDVPYFQIFVIPEKLPYYKKDGTIAKWEEINEHNVQKYLTLSQDDGDKFYHTPKKTLFCVVAIPDLPQTPRTQDDYKNGYLNAGGIVFSFSRKHFGEFSKMVVYNDYEGFAERFVAYIRYDSK